jgi:TolA-binding protein
MEEKDIELLEAYIQGKLNEHEVRSVEKRLANDKAFKSEYDTLLLLVETVTRANTRDKIKAIHQKKLEEWEEGKIVEFKSNKISFNPWLKMASLAAAASLVTVLYFGNAPFDLPNTVSLQERSGATTKGSQNKSFQEYINAQKALGSGDYKIAAKGFEKLKSNEELRAYYQDAAQWFEVVALSEIDENKAAELFSEINANENFKFPIPFLEKMKMKVRLLF